MGDNQKIVINTEQQILSRQQENKHQSYVVGIIRQNIQIYIEYLKLTTCTLWYCKWDLARLFTVPHDLSKILSSFGEAFFIMKLFTTVQNFIKNIRLRDYISLEGIKRKKSRLCKALFDSLDFIMTVESGMAYFIFHAAYATPLFLAASVVTFLKSIYSFSKNIYNFYKLVQEKNTVNSSNIKFFEALFGGVTIKNDDSPLDEKINLKLNHYKNKIKRSTFDLFCAAACVVFTGLFFVNPPVAVLGFIILGTIWFIGRRHLTQKCHQSKDDAVKFATEHLKNNHATLFHRKKRTYSDMIASNPDPSSNSDFRSSPTSPCFAYNGCC